MFFVADTEVVQGRADLSGLTCSYDKSPVNLCLLSSAEKWMIIITCSLMLLVKSKIHRKDSESVLWLLAFV